MTPLDIIVILASLALAFSIGWAIRDLQPKPHLTASQIAMERHRLQAEIAEAVVKHRPRRALQARLMRLTAYELERAG